MVVLSEKVFTLFNLLRNIYLHMYSVNKQTLTLVIDSLFTNLTSHNKNMFTISIFAKEKPLGMVEKCTKRVLQWTICTYFMVYLEKRKFNLVVLCIWFNSGCTMSFCYR